ncbi:hypothetical protein [Micromonospora sp. AKA38]|uniref:hypothetical protein n=1 Tax=Micromonospora sp. AKA38 TaxID=2733861 RepID=UPI0022C30D05|nr:hypothetical protein [Micromonospora sp. AKA38]GHJ15892.1 hypothetical protein TPA0908_38870 [Micromonospora sp. AKA38]
MPHRKPFTARCHTHQFPAGVISPRAVLTFTTDDLVHALFTTGRAPGDRFSHGLASVWELIHRASLIPAYVRRTDGGGLVRSALARELDRSEKGSLSYALGQAMTGIFCRHKLDVVHLLHTDRYASRWGVTFGVTRKRPDLFGWSHQGWVIAEAKGRSNTMEASLATDLGAQKRAIKSIQGQRPWLALGCVASFPPHRHELAVDAVDPSEDGAASVDMDLDLDRYLLAYYEPFLAAIDAGTPDIRDQRYLAARFDLLGLRIGLRRDIAARVRAAVQGNVAGLHASMLDLLGADFQTNEAATVFSDGTLVGTNWEEALTLNDWYF